jgi:sulfur transfer protein SufE
MIKVSYSKDIATAVSIGHRRLNGIRALMLKERRSSLKETLDYILEIGQRVPELTDQQLAKMESDMLVKRTGQVVTV